MTIVCNKHVFFVFNLNCSISSQAQTPLEIPVSFKFSAKRVFIFSKNAFYSRKRCWRGLCVEGQVRSHFGFG